jgi:hypothetical protein
VGYFLSINAIAVSVEGRKEGLIQTGGKWVFILHPVSLEQINGIAQN